MLGMATNSGLNALFSGPRLADIVLVITALEAAVLLAWHHRTGRSLAPAAIFTMLIPGVFLLLALRLALLGRTWPWIALCLVLAGLAHTGDLITRLTRPR